MLPFYGGWKNSSITLNMKLGGVSTLWSNGHGFEKNFNLNVIMLSKSAM